MFKAKVDLHPDLRKALCADEVEVQMIDLIAFKDPAVRNLYRLESATAKPKTLSSAVKLLKSILLTSARAEEIDQANSGALPALAATTAPPPTVNGTAALVAALTAAIGKLAPADTNKETGQGRKGRKKKDGKSGDDKDKVKVPRDKDGRITHWITGMDPCKCGGNHLYRDCDQESTSAKPAGVADGLDSLTKEQIAEQIQAFLGGNLNVGTSGVCTLIESDDAEIDDSEISATEEWCAAASRTRLALPRDPALPLTAPPRCVHRSVTNEAAESPRPSVGPSPGTVERVSGSGVFTHELVPVNVNNMYGVNVSKAATAGSSEPRLCNRERRERGRNPSGAVHTNEHHHPSASLQSVTSWCRPCPANRGHMNLPPGLNLHKISGIPPVGPAPAWIMTSRSARRLLLPRMIRLIVAASPSGSRNSWGTTPHHEWTTLLTYFS